MLALKPLYNRTQRGIGFRQTHPGVTEIFFSLFCIISLSCGCSKSSNAGSGMQPPANESSYSVQAYAGKMETDDGQWIRPAKDFASTRYSSLDQINTGNAKDLQVAWTFSTGMDRGHEAAPLYVNGTIYLITPWPNTLFALDAKNGAIKWQYNPNPSPSSKGVACCDWVNRGGRLLRTAWKKIAARC